jgi:hypothetical protein
MWCYPRSGTQSRCIVWFGPRQQNRLKIAPGVKSTPASAEVRVSTEQAPRVQFWCSCFVRNNFISEIARGWIFFVHIILEQGEIDKPRNN